jgi:hypothetical protein
MNCELAKDYMMRHFDGEQNDIEYAKIKHHISSCAECRDEFLAMSAIMTNLNENSMVEPPPDFKAGVMKGIDLLEEKRSRRMGIGIIIVYNLAAIMSILMITLFGGIFSGNGIFQGSEGIARAADFIYGTAAVAFDILTDMFGLLKGLFGVAVMIKEAVVDTYYFVIVGFFALVLSVYRVMTMQHTQTNGRDI